MGWVGELTGLQDGNVLCKT